MPRDLKKEGQSQERATDSAAFSRLRPGSVPAEEYRKQIKPRCEGIICRTTTGKTFAEVLSRICNKVSAADSGAEMKLLRRLSGLAMFSWS